MLDASALFPAVLCDTLLTVAQAGVYVPVWSEEILTELARNLGARIGDQPATRRIQEMRIAFPEAVTSGFDDLIPALTNHPKDRHVLAAAIMQDADRIVTVNLRDFPVAALSPFGIMAKSPDEFLSDLFADLRDEVYEALERQVARYRRPPTTMSGLLEQLNVHAPGFADQIRRWRR